MKVAYADPPYLGSAKRYEGKHPDWRDWDDPEKHRDLIARLVAEYPDGWAMSLSTSSLYTLLPMCPPSVRIAAWVKPFCAFKRGVRPCYAWEPVIFTGGRNPPHTAHPPPVKGGTQTTPKDFLAESITLKKGLAGAKPERFCFWVFELLGMRPGDELHDLFPGTGAVLTAWEAYQYRETLFGQQGAQASLMR